MLSSLVIVAVPPSHPAPAHQTPSSPSASPISFRSPALPQSKTRAFPALCFHAVTNRIFRNSIIFKILQIQGGVFSCSLPIEEKMNTQTETHQPELSNDPSTETQQPPNSLPIDDPNRCQH